MAIGLTFGLLTRVAAIGGLLLLGPIWLMLLHTNQYLWTYPLDLFPLLLLAIVPAGRVAGLDGKIIGEAGQSGLAAVTRADPSKLPSENTETPHERDRARIFPGTASKSVRW
ncbi:hypothetical protein AB0383_46535 [Amycolatopsis sp. NPDC051373]|uniref:hypothetical protein n=1 Tax=Amycolatopsis sp. NPDC051373 TaxID=3155801 RepID=UPI00344B64AB